MKRNYLVKFGAVALFVASSLVAFGQEKKTEVGKVLQKTGKAVDKGAKAVGNKTAEVAVKGASKITDKVYKGKMAPDSTDVYIDGRNRKYYVNKKGKKLYLKTSQIRNRPVVH